VGEGGVGVSEATDLADLNPEGGALSPPELLSGVKRSYLPFYNSHLPWTADGKAFYGFVLNVLLKLYYPSAIN